MKLEDTIKIMAADEIKYPNEGKIEWITVNGQHIPIKQGQDKESAIKEHFEKLNKLKPKKTKEEKWTEKANKEKLAIEKHKAGLSSEKKLMGLWQYTSGKSTVYKAIMAGDWHKISELQSLLGDKGTTAKQYLKWIDNSGTRTGLWNVEYDKHAGTARLVQKDFGNAAKGQIEITDQQQHAALTAVSKLITNTGLDTSFSLKIMDQFMKDAGLSSLDKVSSAVKSWTGSSTSQGGTWLRKIASDYYGRPFSSEYSGKDSGAQYVQGKSVDPGMHEQVLAVKALATAFAQADGTQYVYRSIGVNSNVMAAVKLAKTNGEEYVNIPMNALSSWSTKDSISFGGDLTLRREVNPDDVWFCNKAMAHLFSDHQNEQEWIMGSKETSLKIKTADVWIKGNESQAPWKTPGESTFKDDNKPKEEVPIKAIDPKTYVNYTETKVSGAQGTNPGGTYKGSDGIDRYVKFYNSPGQGQGESLANSIYRDLGIGAPKSSVVPSGSKEAYVSTIIPGGKTLQQQGATAEDAKQVLKGFAADVLTANWDAVGTGLDNILMKDGQAFRIDNGAAFLYRAQGALKPSDALNQITEWDKFFSKNPHYSGLAAKAGVTKAEDIPGIKQQVKDIVALRDKHNGWDNYVDEKMPNIKATDGNKIVSMLEVRTKLLQDKVKDMKASIDAGGPGSGRKPSFAKGLNQWKTPEKERALALKDPKQMKLPMKANKDNTESEAGPITRQLGKKIIKEGTQYCVYGEKDPLGCYPSKEKAMTVARGGSFIQNDLQAGTWEDPNKYGKHFDITHHAYKTVRWGVDDDNTLVAPLDPRVDKIRDKYRRKIKKANKKMIGGVVASALGLPKIPSGGVHKMPMGVGHVKTNPTMKHGKGVGHRFTNPSFKANKLKADGFGEPMAGNMGSAHLDTNLWFTPPSLAKRGKGNHIPTDDPGEKNNKFLDVTKRNSKDTNTQRMKILKRAGPGGLPPQLPAHTTLIAPHTAAYLPGMYSQAMRRKRRNGGSFRAYGAAQI
jgi:hypothetical protein